MKPLRRKEACSRVRTWNGRLQCALADDYRPVELSAGDDLCTIYGGEHASQERGCDRSRQRVTMIVCFKRYGVVNVVSSCVFSVMCIFLSCPAGITVHMSR